MAVSDTISKMQISVLGKTIYYETFGKADQTIVFVHGWGGTHKSLRKLALKASRKWRTVLFDLPGFGKSDNPNPDWGVGEYSACIVEFLKQLAIEKPVYFGHSFGGSCGIFITANNLMPVSHLILCASSFKRTGKTSKVASAVNTISKNYFPFFEEQFHTIKLMMYRLFFRNSDLAKYPHLEPNFRKIVTQDLSDLPEKITVPTLIVWGARDTYTPVDFADELERKIAGSRKVVYPHKSHNLPIRYPDDVWKEMKSFLS